MPNPKKPTQLKILQGTRDKSREPKNEPKPDAARPEPPGCLNDIAMEEYKSISEQLYDLGLLTGIDKMALAAYCNAYSMWFEACQIKNSMPDGSWMTNTTANGYSVKHPIVSVINETQKAMKDFLVEFGMTPASRSKVSAKKSDKKDNPFEKFG